MQYECPQCHAVLDFADKRPLFCAFCGHALSHSQPPGVTQATLTPPSGHGGASTAPCDTADVTLAAPAPNADPDAIGGYRLLRVLGHGGMGKVYEAEDTACGRHVALKLISGEFATSKETVERFRQEGRLASALVHPRCVFVYAADEDSGRPYIVMELMPGQTLQEVVKERGRLPVGEAVAKILDVIEGLQEAHQLGVVHRDVKPSNCFLESTGRVKIGDFGLSKSLVSNAHLTRTGAFMGTPLYAAPEQIRGDKVNVQTDLYAVAATLYCLLVGRAPFQSNDATATLARIVADDPPPLRTLRPDIPAALDKVVLRGLARDRDERWHDLEEFRQALLPFLADYLKPARRSLRVGAYLIDFALFLPLTMTVGALPTPDFLPQALHAFWESAAVPWVLYFLLLEGWWGCSLGKRCLRLRVATAAGERPGLARAALRTLVFYSLVSLPCCLVTALLPPSFGTVALLVGVGGAGVVLVAAPMRRANGYRGPHDWLSGTRVVVLPRREHRLRLPTHRLDKEEVRRPAGLPNRLGHFDVRGILRGEAHDGVLLGRDTALDRTVVLWLRPPAGPPLSTGRRDLSRPTRLRWLAAGHDEGGHWDAFLAPTGCPLPELVRDHGRLTWAELRPYLETLTEELAVAVADGTLPSVLGADQVWVQARGRIQVLEVPLTGPAAAEPALLPVRESSIGGTTADGVALALLRQVAVLALEGGPARAGAAPVLLRAPVPGHMAGPFNRLLGGTDPYQRVGQWQEDLVATADRPTEVTGPRRAVHLAILTAFLLLPLLTMLPAGALASFHALDAIYRVQGVEAGLPVVQADAYADAATALTPQPFVRLFAVHAVGQDRALAAWLEQGLERRRGEYEAGAGSLGIISRWYLRLWLDQTEHTERAMALNDGLRSASSARDALREKAVAAAGWIATSPALSLGNRDYWRFICFLVAWPVAWVLWAFLFRGGFSYPLAGIRLLRSDGRPASRWQCAVRAALVWLPVAGLLLGGVALEVSYFSVWYGGTPASWRVWLGWALWWLGMGLPPAYALVALWRPAQAPHDRLAGTYLMPD